MQNTLTLNTGSATEDDSMTPEPSLTPSSEPENELCNPRNKTALKPGRSLMDWVRLTNSGKDLTGTGGCYKDVTVKELSEHNKREDAWMAIRGLVYNVTPYFEFHPGGEDELLKGVGKDATSLFEQVHGWVNLESMFRKCIIGKLVRETVVLSPEKLPTKATPSSRTPPLVKKLSRDRMETPENLTLVFYGRRKDLTQKDVSLSLEDRSITIRVSLDENIYTYKAQLIGDVALSKCGVVEATGKIEIVLRKLESKMWIRSVENESESMIPANEESIVYHKYQLVSKTLVTHNVWFFTFQIPDHLMVTFPIGSHVHIRLPFEGGFLSRRYTPVNEHLQDIKESQGLLHFLIKVYEDGPFTTALDKVPIKNYVEMSYPVKTIASATVNSCQELILLAAGSGITPMVNLLKAVLSRKSTVVKLLFFNKSERDIIWKERWTDLANEIPERFSVTHVLSEPPVIWTGEKGRVNSSLLKSFVPENRNESLFCVCGPTNFTNESVKLLQELEVESKQIYAFVG